MGLCEWRTAGMQAEADWMEAVLCLFSAECLALAKEENDQINSTFQQTLQDLNSI